jgi:hypothetical protein
MRRNHGLALAAVVFVLVVLGTLAAVAFHAGHLELRTGRNSLYAAEAIQAAEAGVAVVLEEWEAVPALGGLVVNQSVTLPVAGLGPGVTFQATVLRLTEALWLIRSEGARTDARGTTLARRVVARLVRAGGPTVAPLVQRSWVQSY